MKRVVIESPYAGSIEGNELAANVLYARMCLLDSLNRGEAPIASHLLHTQVLDDTDPAQRKMGIAAGVAWHTAADLIVFYVDRGWSRGMEAARGYAVHRGVPYVERNLPKYQLRTGGV